MLHNPQLNRKICEHTNQISKDCIFFALPGKKEDKSFEYAKYAAEHGAHEIVAWKNICDQLAHTFPNVVFTSSSNPRAAYTQACKNISGYTKTANLIGITGTKGKTSLAWMINMLLDQTGYIGTLGTFYQNTLINFDDMQLSCPMPMQLYENLHTLQNKNAKQIALEYTSIGIDSMRCIEQFDVGILTNFTGDDHLIFHNTLENYQACKMAMFEQSNKILMHANDPLLPTVQRMFSCKPIYTYSGTNTNSICHIVSYACPNGFESKIYMQNNLIYAGPIRLLGNFQLDNLAGAIAACILLEQHNIVPKLTHTNLQIPGRMEIVGANIMETIYHSNNTIVLDYAHTPNSLQKAIQALKEHQYEHIIVIFGCGGERDWNKREQMGKIASQLCTHTIITDDNPRTENPASIRKMILDTCPNGIEISNRSQAIAHGIELLSTYKNSALLVAGKGHEEYQIIGADKLPYSDKEEILSCLNALAEAYITT